MSSKVKLMVPLIVALAGCNTVNSEAGSADRGMGEAAKYNAALQIIDPDPVYTAASSQPGDRGEKGQKAVERYRKDQVKQVEVMATTSGSSGSGSSGPR